MIFETSCVNGKNRACDTCRVDAVPFTLRDFHGTDSGKCHWHYVLTNLSSLKIFQQKTGITIKDHPNIYVDRENLFVVPTNNSIYPCVIQLKEGQIAEHTFQSPQTVIFQQLKQHLKEDEN